MAFDPRPVVVLGAGSWGTSMALLLSRDGGPVRLWDRTPAQVALMAVDLQNSRYLPGHRFPVNLRSVADIGLAVAGAFHVVVAVPTGGIEAVLDAAAPYLSTGAVVVLATKGIDPSTGALPHDIACATLSRHRVDSVPIVALSGPNLAREVAAGVPTAAVAAGIDSDAATSVAERFNRSTFRTYVSDDIVGVEVAGAVKNVLAIAAGISDGLGFGDNTKAALMTRGLGEMARLVDCLGGRRETVYGLAGVGDLMATSNSRLSRNWRVGHAIGSGRTLAEILGELGQVAEGVPTARAVAELAGRHELALPVCVAVDDILAGRATPQEALLRLTEGRGTGPELN